MNAKRISKEIRHQDLVELVENELLFRGYDPVHIELNTDYNVGGTCGEIDLYAFKTSDMNLLLFEMKCSNSPRTTKKATEQLKRAVNTYVKQYMPHRKVYALMAYYDDNSIDGWDCKWIKNIGGKHNG